MGETASFGIVGLCVVVILYFVVKTAVKNGINQSMLFSEQLQEARRKQEERKKNTGARGFDREI